MVRWGMMSGGEICGVAKQRGGGGMAKEFGKRHLYSGGNGFDYVHAEAGDFEDGVPFTAAEQRRYRKAEAVGGYGRDVPSLRCIRYEGRRYRVRYTCFSNAGSHWFVVRGRKIYIG